MFREILYQQLVFISNSFADPFIVTTTSALILIFLVRKRFYLEAAFLLSTSLSIILTAFLKGTFKLPRPDAASVNIFLPTDVYGFPSGHTVFYTVFFGYLIYMSFRLITVDPKIRIPVRIISLYFISLVGISRVVLQAHFVHDVLFGYFVGAVFLFVLIRLQQFARRILDIR
jgi:membrane-associated phospholipid phosphatase